MSGDFRFCSRCRAEHSERVLVVQADFGKPIQDVLVELVRFYPKADTLAGALGVSQVTLYAWVRTCFGLDFGDFRRRYVCRIKSCLILDCRDMPRQGKYDAISQIRQEGICACAVGRERARKLVIANCNMSRLRDVFLELGNPGSNLAPHVIGRKVTDKA
jgi:hypothetical protein